eukprot:g30460.t1
MPKVLEKLTVLPSCPQHQPEAFFQRPRFKRSGTSYPQRSSEELSSRNACLIRLSQRCSLDVGCWIFTMLLCTAHVRKMLMTLAVTHWTRHLLASSLCLA